MRNLKDERKGIQTKIVTDATGRPIGTTKVYPGTIQRVQKAKKAGRNTLLFMLVAALGIGGYILVDKVFGNNDAPTILPKDPAMEDQIDFNVDNLEAFVSDSFNNPSIVPVEYTFKKGDTLWGIASKIYTDKDLRNALIEEIKATNNIVNPKNIKDGSVLIINVPEERLGSIGYTEGYSSYEEEHYNLSCYIRDNEWVLAYLEQTPDNQTLRAEYYNLKGQVSQLEGEYSREQDPAKRDAIMRKIVEADRILLGFVEHYAQDAYVPGVVQETKGGKAM